jgi:hypothetical protein
VLRDDPARAGAAHLRHRGAEGFREIDLDRFATVADSDAADGVGLPILVVLRANDVLERALADSALAPHHGLGGVLVVIAGERDPVAPDDAIAQCVGHRQAVGAEFELLRDGRLDLRVVGVRLREREVDQAPRIARRDVRREHGVERLDVIDARRDDPASRDWRIR